jgi:hypothetical protein
MNFLFTVKHVNLVILVNRQHITVGHTFTEPANSYDIHGHYPVTWPPACPGSWPQFHI